MSNDETDIPERDPFSAFDELPQQEGCCYKALKLHACKTPIRALKRATYDIKIARDEPLSRPSASRKDFEAVGEQEDESECQAYG